jgi:glycosyltransferase involved in cell wall biosynthesis
VTQPTLSICIPTYNRSRYLAELLDSIVSQGFPEIEVIVGDDTSPDNTAEVVETYRAKLPNLKYKRNETNIGLDLNFLQVIADATSDYAWLMGDDDRLEPGAIAKVLAALKAWPGITGITTGVINYDRDLSRPTGARELAPTTELVGIDTVFTSIIDQLGFMSTLVVNRNLWTAVCREDPIMDFRNFYIMVYIVGRMIVRSRRWLLLGEHCVGCRTGNDQLKSKFGWFERLRIDVVGHEQLGDALLMEKPAARRRMRELIFRTHVMARIYNGKCGETDRAGISAAIALLFRYYKTVSRFWLLGVPILMAPRWVVRAVRMLYHNYVPASGTQRASRLTNDLARPRSRAA